MHANSTRYPNRWLESFDAMVEPNNKKKWMTPLIVYLLYVALVGFSSGLMQAAVAAYILPLILALLIVVATTLDYFISRSVNRM